MRKKLANYEIPLELEQKWRWSSEPPLRVCSLLTNSGLEQYDSLWKCIYPTFLNLRIEPKSYIYIYPLMEEVPCHFLLSAGVIRVWFAHEFVQMMHVILYPDSDLAPLQPQVAIPVLRRLKSTNILFLVAGVSHVDR